MAVDVSSRVAKAEAALQQRKYDMAMEIFLQALEIDPDNRAARRGARVAALKKHEHSYPSAMAIKLQTAPARMGMMTPNALRKIAAHEAYLKVDPRNLGVSKGLAEALEKAGYLNGAIGVWEGILEHSPKEASAHVNLGRLLAGKEPESALQHLERALQIDGRNQEAVKLRKDLAAELSIKRTGFETATTTHDLLRDKERAKELLKAERLAPTAEEAGDAVGRLTAQLRGNPADTKLLRQLARAHAAGGDYAAAKSTWARIIELDPTDFDARVQLGDLRISELDRELAGVRRSQDEARVAELEARRTQIQIEEFGIRVAEHPTDLGLRFQLGEALLRAGELDEAIGEFQRAVKDPRKRVDALGLLGECFLQKGLYELAARQLERALEEGPGLNSDRGKQIVYNLGLLHERQGDHAAAKEQYLKVYEVDVGFRDVARKVTELSSKP